MKMSEKDAEASWEDTALIEILTTGNEQVSAYLEERIH